MSDQTDIVQLLDDTHDLADQDRQSGHLTEFWFHRVNLLLDHLGVQEAFRDALRDIHSLGHDIHGDLSTDGCAACIAKNALAAEAP